MTRQQNAVLSIGPDAPNDEVRPGDEYVWIQTDGAGNVEGIKGGIAPAAPATIAHTPAQLDAAVTALAEDPASAFAVSQSSTFATRPDRAGFVDYPRHLRRWATDLAEAGQAQKHIVVLGDSITVGAYGGGTGTANWRACGYVAHLRREIEARWGNVGSGHAKSDEDTRFTLSGGSTSSTVGPCQKGRQIAAGNTITFATDESHTGFIVTYWDQGGAFSWAVDGGGATTVTPTGADVMASVAITGLSDATHSLVLTGVGTAHIGTIRPTRGTTSGIVVNRFGRSGATSETVSMGSGSASNRARMLDATFKITGCDLAIIAVGANDTTAPVTPANFRAYLKLMTDYVTALGGCSLLVAGPRYADTSVQDTLHAQALDLAATDDHVAYIDLADSWTSFSTVNAADLDFMYDTIHPNSAGHLSYGQFLARAVLAAQPVA